MRISLFWIIPFLSALAGYCTMRMVITPQTIKSPSLCGISLNDACAILSNHNIPLQIIQYKIDSDTPDNTVISQTPAAHQTMRLHQTMFLTISQKPKTQKTPHFYQKYKDIIQKICTPLGVKPRYFPLKVPSCKNTCFAQYPAADSGLSDMTMIIYTVSDQSDPIIWPNFINKPLQEVIQFLENYGITPHITYTHNKYNNNHANTFVVDQRPLAGSLIDFKEDKKPVVQLKVNT